LMIISFSNFPKIIIGFMGSCFEIHMNFINSKIRER